MGAIHIDQKTFTVPVVSTENGEAIGKLLTVLFHKSDLSLAYLVIDTQKSDTEEGTHFFIGFEDILSLNAYSIVVKMKECSPERIIGSFSQGEYIQLVGAKIYSESGLPLGRLEAAIVNARSGELQTISIADKDKRETLDRERIVSVGTSNIVTVREDISVPAKSGTEEQEEQPYQTSRIGVLPLKEIQPKTLASDPADEPTQTLQPEPVAGGGKLSMQPAAEVGLDFAVSNHKEKTTGQEVSQASLEQEDVLPHVRPAMGSSEGTREAAQGAAAPTSFPSEGIRLTTSELLSLIATLSSRQPENPKNESMELLMRKLSKIEQLLTDFVTRKNEDEPVNKISADFTPKTAGESDTVPIKKAPRAELFTLKHPMETEQDPQTAFDTKIHLSGDAGGSGEAVKSDFQQFSANGSSTTAPFRSAGAPPPIPPATPAQKTVPASEKGSSAFWKASGQQILAMCLFAGVYAAMCMFQIL